ncbi:MAG: M1 family metallopeptidase [Saprospiraceae bacterium]
MRVILIFAISFLSSLLIGQKSYFDRYEFTSKDSIRGVYGPYRANNDVKHYTLDIKIDPEQRFLSGVVTYDAVALEEVDKIQIDLFQNMDILKITMREKELKYNRIFDAVFVEFPKPISKGKEFSIKIHYQGKPRVARNAPWDGGFVWKKDNNGQHWIGVACEGDGASLWWPCKDHPKDEAESVDIKVSVPDGLTCVSNGNLVEKNAMPDNYTQWHWQVSYPINNYNVTVNIAQYAHFQDVYVSPAGDSLDCDYYVLRYNIDKAKKQFQQVGPMLDCYDKYFGPYPFWEDGFCLVETPYLGMEHQSAIAYGNDYMRGYKGGMQADGQDWDYIIIHESGHEWFGNAVSSADHADMWIHEGFTTYMEAMYVECQYGFEEAIRHLNIEKALIRNVEPIVGPYDVAWDKFRSSDHYMKGTWILHTMRNAMENDEQWFSILKGFYNENKYKTIATGAFLKYLNEHTNRKWDAVLEQYLTYPVVPTIEFELKEKKDGLEVKYRYVNVVEGFDLPVSFGKKGSFERVYPNENWQKTFLEGLTEDTFEFPSDLYLVNIQRED